MKRLSSIDALRGLVVVLMVMHHSLDAWVYEPARHGDLWIFLRHLGGLPAPGFMLLAGLSCALVAARERKKGLSSRARAAVGIRRGLYVLGIGFSYRIVSFTIDGNHWDEWFVLFRVDILNCMGVALALVTAVCAYAPSRRMSIFIALAIAALFLLPSPWIYGHEFPEPSIYLGNYIGGHYPLALFPLFPWVAFTAVGFALGEQLSGALETGREWPNWIVDQALFPCFALGLAIIATGVAFQYIPFNPFPPHDWWNASPVWMTIRIAFQLVLLGLFARWWRNDQAGTRGAFLQLLGRHSLFIYLVHLEFVYGRVANPLQRQLTLVQALSGAALIVVSFAAASWALEWWKARRAQPRTLGVAIAIAEPPTT